MGNLPRIFFQPESQRILLDVDTTNEKGADNILMEHFHIKTLLNTKIFTAGNGFVNLSMKIQLEERRLQMIFQLE